MIMIRCGRAERKGWVSVEEIEELVRRYNLEEDAEHIIIPLPEKEGHARRCFILKRNFLIIQFPDGHFSDFLLPRLSRRQ